MWNRSLIWMGALVLGVQLTATVAGRAAARLQPAAPSAPELRVVAEGRETGCQITTNDPDFAFSAPTVAPESLPLEQRLVSDAITCFTRSRDLELEPGGMTRSLHAGWSGRQAVELLAEARDRISRGGSQSAVVRAEAHELLLQAGRAADRGLRSPDAAARLTGIERGLSLTREAFELLREG